MKVALKGTSFHVKQDNYPQGTNLKLVYNELKEKNVTRNCK